jgi:hypothetical protein
VVPERLGRFQNLRICGFEIQGHIDLTQGMAMMTCFAWKGARLSSWSRQCLRPSLFLLWSDKDGPFIRCTLTTLLEAVQDISDSSPDAPTNEVGILRLYPHKKEKYSKRPKIFRKLPA